MTTQGLIINNETWVNIIDVLSLEINTTYYLQNVSDSEVHYSFKETIPGASDPFHILFPSLEKDFMALEGVGVWVKSKSGIPRNVSIAVSDDRTILPTEPNGVVPTLDKDGNDRDSLNTVFGEKIVGTRSADIAAQFQYGFPAGSASPEIANGGTISIVESMLVISTGVNIAGAAAISNRKALRYIPGQEAFSFFTAVFTAPKVGSYQRAGLFDQTNGFFIGYEGVNFTVTRRRDSVDVSTTIDVSTIFEPKFEVFDPAKGNVYRITFGYLGFAVINFEIMTPDGCWTLLHKIQYPNTSEDVHILNTNLQPRIEIANAGNNTDLSTKVGSFSAGITDGGGKDPAARRFTFAETNRAITAGIFMAVTFRSKTTFNSIINYISTLITLLSFNTDLSKSSLWELEINGTIVGTPTWDDINLLDSTIEYSTDAVVTHETGTLGFSIPLGKISRVLITDFENQEVEILPGDHITLFITSPVGTSGTFDYSLRWKELF